MQLTSIVKRPAVQLQPLHFSAVSRATHVAQPEDICCAAKLEDVQ